MKNENLVKLIYILNKILFNHLRSCLFFLHRFLNLNCLHILLCLSLHVPPWQLNVNTTIFNFCQELFKYSFLADKALSALASVFFMYGLTLLGLACPVSDII